MPIELVWLVPDKILLSRWSGTVSVDDMRVLTEELSIIFDEATTLIHTVIDLSEVATIVPEAITFYLQSPAAQHIRRGRVGLVQATAQAVQLADLANRMTQRELILTFETRDAARGYLLRHDSPPSAKPPPDSPAS